MPVLSTECADALIHEELGVASMGGKFPGKSVSRKHILESSSSLVSAEEHMMKVGGQEFCRPSFTKSGAQATPDNPERILKFRHDDSNENCIVAKHERKNWGTVGFGDAECRDSTLVNSFVSAGDGHTCHPKTSLASEFEESSKQFEDFKLETADYADTCMGNLSFVETNKIISACERIGESECCDFPRKIHDQGKTSSMSGSYLNQQVVLHAQFQHQLTHDVGPGPQWQQSICNAFERSVMEQERCNDLRAVEIGLTMKRLQLKEAQMCVESVSNDLRRQKISLNQSKASFKESKLTDEKLNRAYIELSRKCADELVAGLVLMFLALAYGGWKYSYERLSEAVGMCQPSSKDPRKSSWFNNPLNSLTGHFQTLACELTVLCRMLVGLAVIAIIASALLRHTAASSSQAMPTTIIMIVLGGICGLAGKFSVDSLGGSGFHWLVLWEVLCFLHALSACFTPSLFRILNDPASSPVGIRKRALIPPWIRKFVFHTILLLVLPVTAGLTPFASTRDWAKHFSLIIFDHVFEPARIYLSEML
eukprot:Gb_37504 [translate_table: standard]